MDGEPLTGWIADAPVAHGVGANPFVDSVFLVTGSTMKFAEFA